MTTHAPSHTEEQQASAAPRPPAPPTPPAARWRWLRWSLKIALGLLSSLMTAALLLALALWAWGGQEGSLANTLALLEKIHLIQGAQGVTGSLAQGGRIAQLQAQFGDTAISAEQIQLQWQAKNLLQGKLQIQKLAAGQVHIHIRPSKQPSPPGTAPRSLALPLGVQVDSLQLGELALFLNPKTPEATWAAKNIAAHYQYQNGQHRAAITALQMYQGQYQAQVQLGAKSPFALRAAASAQLPLPDMPAAPPLVAQLQASGNLLDIRAQLDAHTDNSAQPESVVNKNASSVHLQARIQPWGKLLLQELQGELSGLDLRVFAPQLPSTQISGQLLPQLAGLSTAKDAGDTLNIDLHNATAQPWDAGGLPISRVQGQLLWQNEQLRLPKLVFYSGTGQLAIQGQWQADTGAWQMQGQAVDLDLAQFYSSFAPSRVQGSIQAGQAAQTAPTTDENSQNKNAAPIHFALDLHNGAAAGKSWDKLDIRSAKAEGSWQNGALNLPKIQLHTSDAQLQGSASYQSLAQAAQIDIQLVAPGLNADAKGQISPKNGQGQLQLRVSNARDFSTWLARWPGLDVPPLAGSAQAQASWQGGWEAVRIKANINSPELRLIAQEKLGTVIAKNGVKPASAATESAADLRISQLQVQLDGALSALQLSLQGDWAQGGQHGRAQIQAQAKVLTAPSLQIGLHTSRAELSMAEQNTPLAAGWQLAQAAPIALQWQAGRTQLAAGSLRLTAPQALRVGAQRSLLLQWQDSELVQAASGGIARARSSGQLLGLSHTWLEALSGASLADMGLAGQILLDAHWDVRLDQHLAINASVQRQSGDFYLSEGKSYVTGRTAAGTSTANTPAPQQSAGLRDVYLRITGNDQQLRLQALWDSARAGRVQADIASSLRRQGDSWSWPESSPIKGSVQADLPTLGLWSALAPTGWRVGGKMAFDAAISGNRLAPDLRGQLQVQDLSMRSVLDGIELKNGQLQARFAGTRMELERFHIEGAEGDLNATGRLAWEAGQPSMDMQMQAKRLRASNRPDRRVTVSGSVQAGLQGKRITLKGKLGIDEALILLADSSKPSLGADVHIVRKQQAEQNATTVPSEAQLAAEEAAAQAAAQVALAPFGQQKNQADWALDAAVTLDMGKDMRVRGMGLDTRLGGALTIQTMSEQTTSKGQMALRPEIVGSLHTIGGEYRAYGQWLEIEEGIIRFTGPYNNPQLDILAIRPRTEERVGVRITGPASNPRVALYAENAMPDSEKLAWLILGREGSNGGAEAAMLQQAAVALLGSGSSGDGLAQSIGLDELGYRSAETNSDGTVRESSISIGKRLSRRLYLSYERSLSGALGTLFVFYDISRRFTLRAQTNEKTSALDVIFTRRYQSLLPAKRAALEAAAERERQAEIHADAARNSIKPEAEKSAQNPP